MRKLIAVVAVAVYILLKFKEEKEGCIKCKEWMHCPKELPYILIDYRGADDEMKQLTERHILLERYGESQVLVTSSNTYSEHEKRMSLAKYSKSLQSKHLANESLYLFGPVFEDSPLFNLTSRYQEPPFLNLPSAVSFGYAGKDSGVSFHSHGPGFAEMLHGRKRWFFYPPGPNPFPHLTDTSTYLWFSSVLPKLAKPKRPLFDCTLYPGQLLFFPNEWWHATLNLDHHTIFFSTFLQDYELALFGKRREN